MPDWENKENQESQVKPPESSERTYQRAAWKHLYRWILFLFVVGLDLSMPMSLLSRLAHHWQVKPLFELMQLVFLMGINAWFLPVCLFEINYAIARPQELELGNLIWSTRLTRGQILSLTTPRFLVSALLRTARCFYLINRADIPNSDELLSIISQRYL